jgi:glycosyltransferase involved in cell wall biosynthesis
MKISVITPVLNGEKFIKSCLESTKNQVNVNLEHIIVDGGSTDLSVEIAKSYNVKVFIAPNTSIYEANNIGIKKSTGDIICFLNSDDFFTNQYCLEKVIKIFQEKQNFDLLYGNVHIVNQDNINLYNYQPIKWFNYFICKLALFIVPHSSTFFKKELFNKYGFYDVNYKYSSDIEYILTLKKYGVKFRYENYFFSTFRRHNSNKSDESAGRNDFKLISKKHNFAYYEIVQKSVYLLLNIQNLKYLKFLINRRFKL